MTDVSDQDDAPGDIAGLPLVITAKELAAALQLSPKSVYDMASRGEIPGRVPGLGRRLRFNKAIIVRWLSGAGPKT